MAKRILLMAAHFHPYKGGLENFALDFTTRLAKKGIDVDVFTYNLEKNKEIEKYKGITIYRLPGWSILGKTFTLPWFNSKYDKLIKKIFSKKYDAVITNTRFFTTSFLGMIYAKNMKTKFIHIEHGNVHVIHNNPLVTAVAWLYDQTFGRIIFSNADLVIGISKPCARFAKRLGANKTIVIHNSIDPDKFHKKKVSKVSLGIPQNNKVIINGIGRLIYAKGLQDVIEAVKGIPNLTIVNIGEGPYEPELIRISRKYRVKSLFPGRINREEIIKYLSVADLFINPSYSEGLPTCVLEAGAAGVPVIATDVGGTKEIIDNNVNGLLIKPHNTNQIRKKILYLLNKKPSLASKLQKKIKKEFNWDKNINKFKEII